MVVQVKRNASLDGFTTPSVKRMRNEHPDCLSHACSVSEHLESEQALEDVEKCLAKEQLVAEKKVVSFPGAETGAPSAENDRR